MCIKKYGYILKPYHWIKMEEKENKIYILNKFI